MDEMQKIMPIIYNNNQYLYKYFSQKLDQIPWFFHFENQELRPIFEVSWTWEHGREHSSWYQSRYRYGDEFEYTWIGTQLYNKDRPFLYMKDVIALNSDILRYKTIGPFKEKLPPFNIHNLGLNKNTFKSQFNKYFASFYKRDKMDISHYLTYLSRKPDSVVFPSVINSFKNKWFLSCYYNYEDVVQQQTIPLLDDRFTKEIHIKALYTHIYILSKYINLYINLRDYAYDAYDGYIRINRASSNVKMLKEELPFDYKYVLLRNEHKENPLATYYSPIIYIATTFFSFNKIPSGLIYTIESSQPEEIDFFENEGLKICKQIIDKCDSYIEYSVVQIGVSRENINSIKSNKSILSYKEHLKYVFKQHFNRQPLD